MDFYAIIDGLHEGKRSKHDELFIFAFFMTPLDFFLVWDKISLFSFPLPLVGQRLSKCLNFSQILDGNFYFFYFRSNLL